MEETREITFSNQEDLNLSFLTSENKGQITIERNLTADSQSVLMLDSICSSEDCYNLQKEAFIESISDLSE